jgi:hypothetical protein
MVRLRLRCHKDEPMAGKEGFQLRLWSSGTRQQRLLLMRHSGALQPATVEEAAGELLQYHVHARLPTQHPVRMLPSVADALP